MNVCHEKGQKHYVVKDNESGPRNEAKLVQVT